MIIIIVIIIYNIKIHFKTVKGNLPTYHEQPKVNPFTIVLFFNVNIVI